MTCSYYFETCLQYAIVLFFWFTLVVDKGGRFLLIVQCKYLKKFQFWAMHR
jgi:hypothetical protein